MYSEYIHIHELSIALKDLLASVDLHNLTLID